MLFGDVDDVASVDLKSVACYTSILGGRFDFDHVDVVVHIAAVDVDDVSH